MLFTAVRKALIGSPVFGTYSTSSFILTEPSQTFSFEMLQFAIRFYTKLPLGERDFFSVRLGARTTERPFA